MMSDSNIYHATLRQANTYNLRCPPGHTIYEGLSKSSFLFLIQRKVRILSKFCDVHIEIKYISANWILFEKQS